MPDAIPLHSTEHLKQILILKINNEEYEFKVIRVAFAECEMLKENDSWWTYKTFRAPTISLQ